MTTVKPLEKVKDIVTEVQNYGFSSAPQGREERIFRWINECQTRLARDIESEDFQENGTVTTVANQAEYSLPAGCLRVLSIRFDEMARRLRPITIREYDNLSKEVQGPPDRYAIWKGKLLLYPKPEAAGEVLTVRHIKEPAELKESEQEPTLNKQYLHLLVEYAVARAYESEDDAEMAKLHWEKYREDRASYAADMQNQQVDRPKQLEGTWGMI